MGREKIKESDFEEVAFEVYPKGCVKKRCMCVFLSWDKSKYIFYIWCSGSKGFEESVMKMGLYNCATEELIEAFRVQVATDLNFVLEH